MVVKYRRTLKRHVSDVFADFGFVLMFVEVWVVYGVRFRLLRVVCTHFCWCWGVLAESWRFLLRTCCASLD